MHKKVLVLFLMALAWGLQNTALCQLVESPYIVVGVKGGGLASDMLYTKHAYSVYSHSALLDWQAGGYAKFCATRRLAFELDVQYSGVGTNMSWADVEYTLHSKQVDVRLLQAIQFGRRGENYSPYFDFGPEVSLVYGGNIEYSSDYTPYFSTPVTKGNYSVFDAGLYIGIGFDLQFYLGLNYAVFSAEAGYRCGLISTFSKNDKSENAVIMNPEMDAPLYSAQRLSQGVELSVKLGVPFKIYKKQPVIVERPQVIIPEVEIEEDTIVREEIIPRFEDGYVLKECYTLGEIRDKINNDEDVSGMRICLFSILFDFDKADIRPESDRIISDLAALMRKYPSLKIKVNGHTDSKGGDDYNQRLSESRARAVKYAIMQYGVLGERIEWEGFGERYPIDSNETDKGRSRNRRVEIDILTVPQNNLIKK